MALEKLYTVKEMAAYFGVTETTILRWIKEYNDTAHLPAGQQKGLKAKKLNGIYRAREQWVKDYARVLFTEGSAAS